MGAIFSRGKGHKGGKKRKGGGEVSDQDRAVLDLKAARDSLKKYQTKMKSESGKLQEQARTLVQAGKKDRALLLLKLKRYKEAEADKADKQLLNVYQMIQSIEWERQQLDVFKALQQGKDTLQEIHKIMSVEDVEKLMADSQEAIEYEQEISRLLAGSLSTSAEDEVMAEFAALEKEEDALAQATAQATAQADKPQEEPVAVEGGEGEGKEEGKHTDTDTEPEPLQLPDVPTHPLPTPQEEVPVGEEEAKPRAERERQPVLA